MCARAKLNPNVRHRHHSSIFPVIENIISFISHTPLNCSQIHSSNYQQTCLLIHMPAAVDDDDETIEYLLSSFSWIGFTLDELWANHSVLCCEERGTGREFFL
jgi:hypothetical protein